MMVNRGSVYHHGLNIYEAFKKAGVDVTLGIVLLADYDHSSLIFNVPLA
jgi:hypothetical protein